MKAIDLKKIIKKARSNGRDLKPEEKAAFFIAIKIDDNIPTIWRGFIELAPTLELFREYLFEWLRVELEWMANDQGKNPAQAQEILKYASPVLYQINPADKKLSKLAEEDYKIILASKDQALKHVALIDCRILNPEELVQVEA